MIDIHATSVDEEELALGQNQQAFDGLGRMCERHPGDFWVRSPHGGLQLVLRSSAGIREVLIRGYKDYGKGRSHANMKLLMGEGLIVQEGEVWRRQRFMMQPMFHDGVLLRTVGVLRRHARTLCASWERAAREGVEIDLTDDVSRSVLDTLLESLFGEDLERVGRGDRDPFGFLVHGARELALVPRFRRAVAGVDEVVRHRLRHQSFPPDLLSMLITARDRSGEPMTLPRIRDEIATLIVAGHETTAAMLAWAWYELSGNGEAWERARAEADAADPYGSEPTTMPRLPFVTKVLLEVLRLYPPVWLEDRVALSEVSLGGWSIPRGTEIFIPIFFLHREPRCFPSPNRFWPDRFEADELDPRYVASVCPDAPSGRSSGGSGGAARSLFLPFSLGPRRCIGDQLALLAGRVHLGVIAQRLRLQRTSAVAMRMVPRLNLRPDEGMRMRPVLRAATEADHDPKGAKGAKGAKGTK